MDRKLDSGNDRPDQRDEPQDVPDAPNVPDEYDPDEELDERYFERLVARRQPGAEVESLLHQVRELVEVAEAGHFSRTVKIDRDKLLELLDQAIGRFPEELRGARWMLKEREEFLARTRREADEILAAARGQSERMVQRSEVLRSAEGKARRIVERARADAARIRNECDDYCDQRLAQLEAALERTMTVVAAGRRKLRPSVAPDGVERGRLSRGPAGRTDVAEGQGAESSRPVMFDQDRA